MEKSYFTGVDKCLKPLLKKGVDQGAFSGVTVGLYTTYEKEHKKVILCSGKTKNDPGAITIKDTTFFDLASLTKPLCTVLLILHLIEKNKLSWETRLDYLFGTKTAGFLKKIEIAHLLSHSSGLKAYEPYYQGFQAVKEADNKKKLLSAVFKEKPLCGAGQKIIYSDLGYILLGEIIEKVSGEKINDLFKAIITEPLGLEKQVLFKPVEGFLKTDKKDIAATQNCPWRNRLLQGEVDDEHCWLMDGVAGHAGLFGTIHGVLDMTAHLLNQWQGKEEHPSYSNKLLQRAMTRQHKNKTWCLGFDTPSATGSSGGCYLSEKSVGHLGFTGTSFWIDKEKEMVIVLLTNRVHLTRNNEKIKKFRPLLHDAVFQALHK